MLPGVVRPAHETHLAAVRKIHPQDLSEASAQCSCHEYSRESTLDLTFIICW